MQVGAPLRTADAPTKLHDATLLAYRLSRAAIHARKCRLGAEKPSARLELDP